ncbi:MAG: hypothetical protein JW920_11120 [Deltaproteobacteria bacterium]|nr:hypothetical protein [Deltaproteobacteria bacterium]
MPKRLSGFSITFLFVMSLVCISACGDPKVFIENPVFDAGNIAQGKKIEHTFIIQNIGYKVLTYEIKRC